ncbi:sulfite exporter TauE/SafE family protein [Patescibacteria group bacterium]|nr:sulfite exporter TauE/SafE family protein [Patescibacteria group bacterium]
MSKNIVFKISGMHCQSCKTLLEMEIKSVPGVKNVKVDYISGKAEVEVEPGEKSASRVIDKIKEHGYGVEVVNEDQSGGKKSVPPKKRDDFEIRVVKYVLVGLGAVLLLGIYFILEKNGALEIFSRLQDKNLGYGLLFIIGLLASFHCVGMCGGLVVTYTAGHCLGVGDRKNFLPHFYYNFGRVISYTVIGAILGGIGSFFGINPVFSGILTLFAAVFMLAMGASLVRNINFIEKIKSKIPAFIAKYLFSQKRSAKPRGPFFIGLLNGLMPCGPLQAVQFYALGTGRVWTGALSMFFFALGTSFLMFGFGYFISSISGERIKKMMKISGVVVILLGLFMLNRGLSNFGIGFRSLLPRQQTAAVSPGADKLAEGEYQTVKMDLTYRGYVPNVLYAKKGIPVRWVINVKQMSGCTNAILVEKFGINQNLKNGENIIEFTPTEIGEIPFSCWMKMVWGKFVVTD